MSWETHLSLDGDQLTVQLFDESLRRGQERHDVLMVQKHPSRGAFLQPLRRLAACLQVGTQTGETHRQDGRLTCARVHKLPSVQELALPPTSLNQRRPRAEPVSQQQTLSTIQSQSVNLKHSVSMSSPLSCHLFACQARRHMKDSSLPPQLPHH